MSRRLNRLATSFIGTLVVLGLLKASPGIAKPLAQAG